MRIFLILAAVMAAECVEHYKLDAKSLQQEWKTYKGKYDLAYDDAEDKQRFINFFNNIELIEHHNQQYDAGVHTYSLGVNQFTHLTQEEYEKEFGLEQKTIPLQNSPNKKTYKPPIGEVLPKSWDWREKGAVTPVKDQGKCRAHWLFASVGSLEGAHQIKTGKLESLSEQQLLDCGGSDYGCVSSYIETAYFYMYHFGVQSDESYPYVGYQQNQCKFNNKSVIAPLSGYEFIMDGEEFYASMLVNNCPIVVIIDALMYTFRFYKSGVYNDPECGKRFWVNTFMLIVGYGNEDGQDYWLLKNAWGETWGDKGYIKIVKGKNMCNIGAYCTYALVL